MDTISFQPAIPDDAPQLTAASIRAFHSDIDFGAESPKGPPGYDQVSHHLQMIEEAAAFYKIVVGEQLAGAFWFIQGEPGKGYLYRIFIAPGYQRSGLGKKAFSFLFASHPEITVWALKTPAWNRRTPRFYQDIGFQLSARTEKFLYFSRSMP